jgi:phosphoribosyl 1,2-cyclic phosphodiesterase
MELKVLGTGSGGNCYLLSPKKGKSLLLECGLTFDKIKKGLDFDLDIAACLLTHEHVSDHAKCPNEIINAGIPLYTSFGTASMLKLKNANCIRERETITIGDWKFVPFIVDHDAVEPFGYMIGHPECGIIVFATDTKDISIQFGTVNHWIIEANYSSEIMMDRLIGDTMNSYLAGRVCQNHMSIETTIRVLKANYTNSMRSVTLIHLSDSNGYAKEFKTMVASQIGIMPNIAENGKTFEL